MPYNSIEEIKKVLLLESENQTLTDKQIETYLSDANEEMISDIKRSIETDSFIAEEDGTVTFYPYFNVVEIKSVKVNGTYLDSDDYEISPDGDGVSVSNIDVGDVVETFTIPSNYKQYEKAICIVNIRSRLNPFSGDTVDGIYVAWDKKRKNFKNALKGKFGAAVYNG